MYSLLFFSQCYSDIDSRSYARGWVILSLVVFINIILFILLSVSLYILFQCADKTIKYRKNLIKNS